MTAIRSGRRLAGSRGGLIVGLTGALLMSGCDAGGNGDASPQPEPEPAPAANAELGDDAAKASYSLGFRFAENVEQQFGGSIQSDAFVRGVGDRLEGRDALVGDEEAERVLTALMEDRQAEVAAESLNNLEAGHKFLEENAQREEVVALESGLQYEVLEPGEGEKPDASDMVTTHYEGRLIDGTVFDSSYQRGEPATFPLDRVIPGWTEGLQLMSPGAKYRLFVPAELAYGDRPAGTIPPNSALIFDVELLNVEQSSEEAADAAADGAAGEAANGG